MNHKTIASIVFLYCFFCLGLSTIAADDLAVKVYVDNTVVGLNQQFTLHVELSGKDVNSASNPQLPKMDHFSAYLGSGTSQNMQFINGKMSISKTISYHFQATKIGKFQIDPITVNAGGKQFQTDPLAIEIQKASTQSRPSRREDTPVQGSGPAEGDLFLRALVNKRSVFQNEPVTVTYKIYTRVNVSSFGFSKLPGTTGFWVEEFPIGRQPETRAEIMNGKRYTVATIKKMALFPMTPGKKTIDPLGIECKVRVQRRSRSIFDDFFSDPFGKSVRKMIQSPAITIDVLPLPEEGRPRDFSGVVGKFKLSSTVDKTNVKTNEAVSLKVIIEGQGNIRTIPELEIPFPPDFEVYPPKSSESVNRKGTTISGRKTYEYVLVPRVSGLRRIKPVRLTTFEPVSKSYKILETDEIVFDVAKGDETFIVTPTGLTKKEVELLGQDIRFIKTEMTSFRRMGTVFSNSFLLLTLSVFPLLTLGGAILYRRHSDRIHGDEAYARDRRASRLAKKRLSLANTLLKPSAQKEFYAEVGRALTGYLGDKLNIAEAGMISDDIQNIFRKKGLDEGVVEYYFECLKGCDLQRFSPSNSSEEEMKTFLHKAENAIVRLHRAISK